MQSSPIRNVASLGSRSATSTILEGLRLRDAEAWRRLVDLLGPLVYRWCRAGGVSSSDADDLTQEVFQSVWVHLETFHRSQQAATFRGWLYRITRNKICDHYRRLVKRPNAVGGSDAREFIEQVPEISLPEGESVESAAESRQTIVRRGLEMIRNDFDAKTWTAFLRVTVDGCSSADVGSELGMRKDAVRQAKHRVLRRLREEFGWLLAES